MEKPQNLSPDDELRIKRQRRERVRNAAVVIEAAEAGIREGRNVITLIHFRSLRGSSVLPEEVLAGVSEANRTFAASIEQLEASGWIKGSEKTQHNSPEEFKERMVLYQLGKRDFWLIERRGIEGEGVMEREINFDLSLVAIDPIPQVPAVTGLGGN